MVKQLNIEDGVNYLGAKYGTEKVEALKKADALVFPSHGETFCLVLLEAMEYGLPCISTFEGGIPSVVDDGETGFLVQAKDVEALAGKMCWLVEHQRDGMEMGKKVELFFRYSTPLSNKNTNAPHISNRT